MHNSNQLESQATKLFPLPACPYVHVDHTLKSFGSSPLKHEILYQTGDRQILLKIKNEEWVRTVKSETVQPVVHCIPLSFANPQD